MYLQEWGRAFAAAPGCMLLDVEQSFEESDAESDERDCHEGQQDRISGDSGADIGQPTNSRCENRADSGHETLYSHSGFQP